MTAPAKCPGCGRDADFVETHGGARSCYHPFHAAPVAHGEGEAVTLIRWRSGEHLGTHEYREKQHEPYPEQKRLWGCEEYRALPAAAYDALLARLAAAEKARDEVAALLKEARAMLDSAPAGTFCPDYHAPLLNRIDAALKRDGEG